MPPLEMPLLGTTTLEDQIPSPLRIKPPYVFFSLVARHESWRKELYRPTTHIHRWWATRLGTVFRFMLIDALKGEVEDIEDFYSIHEFADKIVLDPFMGSGTTLVEALKLGTKTIGVDINELSNFIVEQSLKHVPLEEMNFYLAELERTAGRFIRDLYTTRDVSTGKPVPVLYFFWVKVVRTPSGEEVPLFPKYIFAKNAYPEKRPRAQVICPSCWNIFTARFDAQKVSCPTCGFKFNPQLGPAPSGSPFVHDSMGKRYKIIDLISEESPPGHRLYAVLAADESTGEKKYQAATDYDIEIFNKARTLLLEMEEGLPLPSSAIQPGRNTSQALRYGYRKWRDFFNERQLLSLGVLLRSILSIESLDVRHQFLLVFSSALEYNNMFATYKGEGTGAVRPIFSNHILKPERLPLENNVWGTRLNSGSFLTLYRNKYLRGKKYLSAPTDILLTSPTNRRARGQKRIAENQHPKLRLSSLKVITAPPIKSEFALNLGFDQIRNGGANLLTAAADSRSLDFIPSNSVDAVVTDPPYFDFINYSELSDFFYAWVSTAFESKTSTTRRSGEVQNADSKEYCRLLKGVFKEMHRVLKPGAPMSFTFHHSSPDGWWAMATALKESGFHIKKVFAIYGENIASVTKSGTKHPIRLDAIIKAVKPPCGECEPSYLENNIDSMIEAAINKAAHMITELSSIDNIPLFAISKGDIFVLRSAWLTYFLVNAKVESSTMLSAFRVLHEHVK